MSLRTTKGIGRWVIVWLFCMLFCSSSESLFGVTAGKGGSVKSKLQKMYLDHLKEEGFKAEVDEDGDVRFKREGKTYFISIDEKDPLFFRVVLPNFWEIENDDERIKVLRSADWANGRTKSCKIFSVRNNLWASVDIFLPKLEEFKAVMSRCFSVLDTGVQNFVERMGEKSE